MLPPTLPTEILPSTTDEVLDDGPSHGPWSTRHWGDKWLMSFHCLAGVCKNWLEPAQMTFWEEMALFSYPELLPFACAIDSSSGKPACIWSLTFWLSQYGHMEHTMLFPDLSTMPLEDTKIANEIIHCLPATLCWLPAYLCELHVDSQWPPTLLGLVLQPGSCTTGPSWAIDIFNIRLQSPLRPNLIDFFREFEFLHCVMHLHLLFFNFYNSGILTSQCPFMQLVSFTLSIHYELHAWCISTCQLNVNHLLWRWFTTCTWF
jgi:hypothetical protein